MGAIQQLLASFGGGGSPLTGAAISVPNTTPNGGASQTVTITATGGTAPYTYKLYTNAGLYGTYTSSAKTYGVAYAAQVAHTSLYATITDAQGTTKTSHSQDISVQYNYGSYASASWSGAVGQSIYLSCTPSCNPTASSYTWYWRVNGGGWSSFASGQTTYSGTTYAGQYYEFYVSTTNAYGTVDSNIVGVQC